MFLECTKQFVKLIWLLKFAQARCVWRADVNSHVVCNRINQLKTLQIVVSGFGQRNFSTLSDAYSQNVIGVVLPNTFGKCSRALVVETRAINQSFIHAKSEKAR